jgi:hypothetical protein
MTIDKTVFTLLVALGVATMVKICVYPDLLIGSQDWLQVAAILVVAGLLLYAAGGEDGLFDQGAVFMLLLGYSPLVVVVLSPQVLTGWWFFSHVGFSAMVFFTFYDSQEQPIVPARMWSYALSQLWLQWLAFGFLVQASRIGVLSSYTIESFYTGDFVADWFIKVLHSLVDLRVLFSILVLPMALLCISREVFVKRNPPVPQKLPPFALDIPLYNHTIAQSLLRAAYATSNLILLVVHFVCDIVWRLGQILGAYLWWLGSDIVETSRRLLSDSSVWRTFARWAGETTLAARG